VLAEVRTVREAKGLDVEKPPQETVKK